MVSLGYLPGSGTFSVVALEQALQPERRGNGIRVWEVVGLDIDMLSLAQRHRFLKTVHRSAPLGLWSMLFLPG